MRLAQSCGETPSAIARWRISTVTVFDAMLRLATQFLALFVVSATVGYLALPMALDQWRVRYPAPAFLTGDYSAHYALARSPVVLYGSRSCLFCQQVRDYFAAKKVPFADLMVDSPGPAASHFAKLDQTAVPVILIGNRMIRGFDASTIDEALLQLPHDPHN
jgi:glutaredoxin